jgi:hypothetical protein
MPTNYLRIAVLIMLVLFTSLYFYTDKQQQRYQAIAEPAVSNILLDISSWQAADMRKHLSQQANQTLSPEQLETLLSQYRPLGKLLSVNELFFSHLMSVFSLLGEPRVSYTGTATFENGPASLTLTLVEQRDHFLIYNLNLSAD